VKLRFAVKALYYEWSQKTCSTAILNGFNFWHCSPSLYFQLEKVSQFLRILIRSSFCSVIFNYRLRVLSSWLGSCENWILKN
jgi:hypothetical protein